MDVVYGTRNFTLSRPKRDSLAILRDLCLGGGNPVLKGVDIVLSLLGVGFGSVSGTLSGTGSTSGSISLRLSRGSISLSSISRGLSRVANSLALLAAELALSAAD